MKSFDQYLNELTSMNGTAPPFGGGTMVTSADNPDSGYCKRCGARLADGEQETCIDCRNPLESVQGGPPCPKCGTALQDQKCPECNYAPHSSPGKTEGSWSPSSVSTGTLVRNKTAKANPDGQVVSVAGDSATIQFPNRKVTAKVSQLLDLGLSDKSLVLRETSDFKIGDDVRLKKTVTSAFLDKGVKAGSVGQIVQIHSYGGLIVNFGGVRLTVTPAELDRSFSGPQRESQIRKVQQGESFESFTSKITEAPFNAFAPKKSVSPSPTPGPDDKSPSPTSSPSPTPTPTSDDPLDQLIAAVVGGEDPQDVIDHVAGSDEDDDTSVSPSPTPYTDMPSPTPGDEDPAMAGDKKGSQDPRSLNTDGSRVKRPDQPTPDVLPTPTPKDREPPVVPGSDVEPLLGPDEGDHTFYNFTFEGLDTDEAGVTWRCPIYKGTMDQFDLLVVISCGEKVDEYVLEAEMCVRDDPRYLDSRTETPIQIDDLAKACSDLLPDMLDLVPTKTSEVESKSITGDIQSMADNLLKIFGITLDRDSTYQIQKLWADGPTPGTEPGSPTPASTPSPSQAESPPPGSSPTPSLGESEYFRALGLTESGDLKVGDHVELIKGDDYMGYPKGLKGVVEHLPDRHTVFIKFPDGRRDPFPVTDVKKI
jgi:hypothetical protein